MFSHVAVGTNDVETSRTFYDAILAAIGGAPGVVAPDGNRVRYTHDGCILIVTRPVNGEPACLGNGMTVGFKVGSPELVEAWHAAGVASGGVSCENPPGERNGALGRLYLAYLRDPQGNKLCAVHRMG